MKPKNSELFVIYWFISITGDISQKTDCKEEKQQKSRHADDCGSDETA
jgi:hypothetical protein